MPRNIEEFLKEAAERRAAAQRAQQAGAEQPPPAQAAREQQQREAQARLAQQRQAQQRQAQQQQAQQRPSINQPAEVADAIVIGREKQQRSQRPLSDLSQQQSLSNLENSETSLAATGAVESKFDHQLGSFDAEKARTKQTADSKAAEATSYNRYELAEMLKDPNALRTAIILREVLERPEHRW